MEFAEDNLHGRYSSWLKAMYISRIVTEKLWTVLLWDDNVKRDFNQWLRENRDKFPEYKEAIDEYLKRQK